MAGEVDLNAVAAQPRMAISISTEKSAEQLAAEIHEKREEGALRRHKDRVLFYVGTGVAIAITIAALVLLFRGDTEQTKWATETLGVLGGGFVGYLVGRRKE